VQFGPLVVVKSRMELPFQVGLLGRKVRKTERV